MDENPKTWIEHRASCVYNGTAPNGFPAPSARVSSNVSIAASSRGRSTAAVWHLAWPAMLQNAIGGAQGIVDHAMVGQVVGFTGNAAIGVSWQIFLIVIVFISSLYTGMGVLVARHAGAGDATR